MCDSKGGSCTMGMIAKILLIVGGVNWGLVGIGMLLGSDWNVVHMIFGSMSTLEAIIYVLVGIVAAMKIFGGCKCGQCSSGSCSADGKMGGNM